MFRILHLSDVHIGNTYKEPESIACKVASDIDHNGLNTINCIIITGDIFDGQIDVTDSLINTAVKFFETLLGEINSNQDKQQISKDDVIFVPGNHDLIRVDDFQARWSKYHSFLEKFYGNIPTFYNDENYSLFKEYKDYKLVFIGFNSCEIEKRKLFDEKYVGKFEKYIDENKLNKFGINKTKVVDILRSEIASDYDDYGYISLSQITPSERKIKKLDDYTVVALFHHHFYLFPEVAKQFGDSSLIRNYAEVIQHLRYMNVSVVLHGHKHFALERPFIMDDYYESAENIIDVFAGGSLGTNRKEEHTFGVLDLYERKDDIKLRHYKFVYNGENLEPIVKKQIPPQKLSGRVVKLLEILRTINPEKYVLYEETAEKAFKSYDSCSKIISWVSEAITGFIEVYKYLDQDYNNILFLIYAINYRTICYMKIVGKEESYYESASKNWQSFYDETLGQTDFTVSKNDYHNMFMHKKLKGVTSFCDKLLNNCDYKKTQVYLAFTMLGMFFADLYLVLTKYADDFKESIKYKVNIKIEENKFHENVPASRIVVNSDADRRSVYIDLLCNEATAHKMAVLFVKEFDLLINKFEDYFKIIGLKIYYLLPRIDKDRMRNTLDNYNFEAYIPTLIPLLTGDNIYSSKVVFARELIQNAIDAISVREEKDESGFSNNILIELNVNENGKKYFKIVDNGIGMDRYKIERYFTSIGRSFYSSEEYADLNINYKPISNFGIGFLSSFMVCKEIDVKTKYYIDNSEGLKLHIPNYDGCFFIELEKDSKVGTEIKLYLDDNIDEKSIVEYIQSVMQDIKYAINIRYLSEKGKEEQICIPAHSVRKQNEYNEFKFFIPFLENGELITLDYIEDIISNNFIDKYEYGLLICKKKNFRQSTKTMILNSGITVDQASISNIFEERLQTINPLLTSYRYEWTQNDIIINFPSNWLQLDVAREKITGFTDIVEDKRLHKLTRLIAHGLYSQILQYIQYSEKISTKIPAICLQEIIMYALAFCGPKKAEKELYENLTRLKYIILIEFQEDGIYCKIKRGKVDDVPINVTHSSRKANKIRSSWLHKLLYDNNSSNVKHIMNHISYRVYERNISNLMDEISHCGNEYFKNRMYSLVNNDNFKTGRKDKELFKQFVLSLLLIPDIAKNSNESKYFVYTLQTILLNLFYVGDEQNQEICIKYNDLLKILGIRRTNEYTELMV